jgi:hypothetical protein
MDGLFNTINITVYFWFDNNNVCVIYRSILSGKLSL